MYNNKTILGFIPARAGSKRIKNKNIVELNDKPLIGWTIEAAKASKYIDYLFVSTDSAHIRDIAKSFGAEVPFLREKKYADDNAKTIDVIINDLRKLKEINLEFDYIILLQPTHPLRRDFHINDSIRTMIDNDIDSLISVVKAKENPVFLRQRTESGYLKNLLSVSSTIRTQDLPVYYRIDGSIYINKIESLDSSTSLNDNSYGYIIGDEYTCDIDDYSDLERVRKLLI